MFNPIEVSLLKHSADWLGNAKNFKFRLKREASLSTNHVKDPNSKRQNFDDLMVYNMDINTIDKTESTSKLDECNNYIIEIETKVETMCLNLRVSNILRFLWNFLGF